MIASSTVATLTSIFGLSAYFIRRRVSKSWIDLRNNQDLENLQQPKSNNSNGGNGKKTMLITGGNTGLGYETARDFARRHDQNQIILACRNEVKGQTAVQNMIQSTGNSNISCIQVDLASVSSIKASIDEIKSNHAYIDMLVCNAGVWYPMDQGRKTKDGYEIHFGVNHLGHFHMVRELIPLLENSGDGRIIFVSSSLMKQGKIDYESAPYHGRSSSTADDQEEEEGKKKKKRLFAPTGYCDSKLMNALTCQYLASTLPPSVTIYSVCPGFCRSSLGQNVAMSFFQKLLLTPIMLLIQRTAVQGAQNIIYVSGERKEKLVNGGMYRDGELFSEGMDYMDSSVVGGLEEATKLWKFSEQLLEDK